VKKAGGFPSAFLFFSEKVTFDMEKLRKRLAISAGMWYNSRVWKCSVIPLHPGCDPRNTGFASCIAPEGENP
jgi:hypothetical protein